MPEYYVVLMKRDGTELERWEVSDGVPRTVGWNLSMCGGREGLGKDVLKAISEDRKPL